MIYSVVPSKYYLRDFERGHFYHIYNRGANKANIFIREEDYKTFLDIFEYYLKFPVGKPLSYKIKVSDQSFQVTNLEVRLNSSFSIICFCLMPNHFHLLIRQDFEPTKNSSISNFMRRVMITYAMYFNHKHNHSGNLFQGRYKNVLVGTDNQLIYLSKYIHLNPSELIEKRELENYPYSSYKDYVGEGEYGWLKTKEILGLFQGKDPRRSYKNFVKDQDLEPSAIGDIVLD